MLNLAAEKSLARVLMLGSSLVTVFVLWGNVTDPVNVTKLLALGGVAGAAFAISIAFGAREIWKNHKISILLLVAFLLSALNSVIHSSAPKIQVVYGAYGRNTGLVTYFLLAVLFLACLLISQNSSFRKISYGLMAAGVINSIYSLWVITFGDFVGWTNPYGNILGTFGNPNFVGAFLGIFASVLFAYLIQPKLNVWIRLTVTAFLLITFIEIKSSHAIQGIVVTAGGIAVVGFYFLRSKFSKPIIAAGYTFAVSTFGLVAVFGALQKGPLADLIYKNSVSLRGQYWHAAWNMGMNFPFSGVGMDTYGDWYRRLRNDGALINPGANTISNAAHNVVLDQLAYGGWPLLLSYLALAGLVAVSIVRVTMRAKEYNFTFIGLTVGWICYQVQSLISINQIGLAIWGWILGGSLVAYERITRNKTNGDAEISGTNKSAKKSKSSQSFGLSTLMVGSIGAVIGLLIAVPPYSSDSKWKAALTSGNVAEIEKSLIPGYLNPQNSYRYASAAQLLEVNKLYDLSYKYAKIGVAYNPDFFDAWKMLYYVHNSTSEDKAQAKKNLLRLDSRNPNIFDVPQS